MAIPNEARTWNAHENPAQEGRPGDASATKLLTVHVAETFPWSDRLQ